MLVQKMKCYSEEILYAFGYYGGKIVSGKNQIQFEGKKAQVTLSCITLNDGQLNIGNNSLDMSNDHLLVWNCTSCYMCGSYGL